MVKEILILSSDTQQITDHYDRDHNTMVVIKLCECTSIYEVKIEKRERKEMKKGWKS